MSVYFIRPIGMEGPIKIGSSCSPNRRRDTLETWSPFPLEIIAEVDGDTKLEWRFHTKYADAHRGREWFELTPELAADIRAIQAGRFDLVALPEPVTNPLRHKCNSESGFRTPAWRYECSVASRLRNRAGQGRDWRTHYNAICAIMGGNSYHGEHILEHKPAIEAYFDAHLPRKGRAA